MEVYADEAEALGLTAGGRFKKRDWGHVQFQAAASPTRLKTVVEIDRDMQTRFANEASG